MSMNDYTFTSYMTEKFDVLVVGAGAAGLYTALCLPEHLQVGLINKNTLPVSASDWAQGGIAAAIAPEDSAALHVQDTLVAGAGLCDLDAVKFLVEEAPACIDSLVKMGVAFDRTGPDLALTLEAAHSRRRVLHSADTTGKAVVSTLTAKVLSRKNIQLISPAFALSLWLNPETGRCQGISAICGSTVKWLGAAAVVLATGGGGQVFAQTTNPSVSTGDGVAIGWRAGAILRDLEFVQFHPTALSKVGAPRFLISEAVRGEGAHLVDSKGYRFAFDYHPNGELAPRDVVSRAIFRHLQKTGEPHVWLDLRPIAVDRLRYRFPNIIQVCADWGIDIFSEPVPVTPAAHYWMGGIVADKFNQTSIPGLYAVGETASTGVHGANRLASNSLLECLVFGAQMADLKVEGIPSTPSPEVERLAKSIGVWEIVAIDKLRFELPQLVWQSAGICRGQADLESAIGLVEIWRQEFISLPLSQTLLKLRPGKIIDFSPADDETSLLLRNWGEVGNLLDIGYLILKSAAFRTESRGGHYRLDYPLTDVDWCRHTLIQNNNWGKSTVIFNPG
jgi:L-aspartate oxidase